MTRLSPSAAFSYAIDAGARLARAVMVGTLTGPDMKRIADTVHQDPAWESSFDVVWDCSRVRAHVIQPDEVSPLVEAMSEEGINPDHTGRNILIESPSLAESMFSRMLVERLRRGGGDAHVVQAMDAALALLDLEELPTDLDIEVETETDTDAAR